MVGSGSGERVDVLVGLPVPGLADGELVAGQVREGDPVGTNARAVVWALPRDRRDTADPRELGDLFGSVLMTVDELGGGSVLVPLLGTGQGWSWREVVQQAFVALVNTPLESVTEVVFLADSAG